VLVVTPEVVFTPGPTVFHGLKFSIGRFFLFWVDLAIDIAVAVFVAITVVAKASSLFLLVVVVFVLVDAIVVFFVFVYWVYHWCPLLCL